MNEIVFIAPYEELALLAEEVSRDLKEPIRVLTGRMEKGVDLARQVEKEGAQVIISRGVTAWRIRQSELELPVVEVPISGYDVVRAYYQAKKLGGTIGIVDVPEVMRGVESLEKIVGERFIRYTLEDQGDIERGISRIKSLGAEVVLGKIAMVRAAARYGMKGVIITSGKESVVQALEESKRVLEVRKREKEKAQQLKAILDFAYDGIIAINKEGIITAFNPVAERLTGWKSGEAIGQPVQKVLPAAKCHLVLKTSKPEFGEILEMGQTAVATNRVPIIVDNQTVGVVTTFQEISNLQKLEHKIRRKLTDRGHVAKYGFEDICGESRAIREAVMVARKYGSVDSTVLITAETGTGKEMFAHAMHRVSPKADGPFVAVNCAALPENLLESELFGYTEGAFTGAKKGGKLGLFELAHGGTIFLDEIGEMSEKLQARVLRVLEQGEVMRLGDDKVIPVKVRVIAATHRNLREMVQEGSFREDLYYRITVLTLNLPPLRERKGDIPVLADRFLKEMNAKFGKRLTGFSNDAMERLLAHSWPGNVRELRNVIERAVLMSEGSLVEDTYLDISEAARPAGESQQTGQLAALEKSVIQRVLKEVNGNKSEAARRLGIGRTTLWRKLKKG